MSARHLFAALFAISLFAVALRETVDPDMWWHLRTGEFILQQGIPRQDIFSFTVPHQAWVTHEWLSQVFMWLVYRATGLSGLIIVFALLTAVTFWLLYRVCPGRPYLAAFVVLLAAVTSAIVWGARPQIFNLLLTAVTVYLVEQFKNRRIGARTLWLLPGLTLLWANLHSGYLLGVVLLATYAMGEAISRLLNRSDERTLSWPAIRQLALVTAVSFAAAAVNPNGPELWIYPFQTLSSPAMQEHIQEWHSPDFHFSYFWPFALMMALGVISWIYSRARPTWSDLLLFGGTAAAGLLSARNIPFFAIIAAPIIARHLLLSAGPRTYPLLSGQAAPPALSRSMSLLHTAVLVLALLVTLLWTAAKLEGNETAIAARYPVTAVDYLEQSGLAATRGYNSYNWGGYLIWRGLPVFVDGRADVYGDTFLFYYLRTFDVTENWQEPLDQFGVQYVLMERGSALTILLAASRQWQEVYRDEVAQIFVRSNP